LLQELTDYGDPHPDLYRAAEQALLELDREASVAQVVLRFEVLSLRLLGILPNLEKCVICGQPAAMEGRVLFGHQAAGILCRGCRAGQRQVVSLSLGAIETLQRISQTETGVSPTTVDRRVWGEMRGLLNHYLSNLMGHPPRMHQYLGPIGV
jgi:DNA repair protein RecO